MLQDVLYNFWQLTLIVGTITLISLLLFIIFAIFNTIIDILKQRKVRNQNISDVTIMIDELLKQIPKDDSNNTIDNNKKKQYNYYTTHLMF